MESNSQVMNDPRVIFSNYFQTAERLVRHRYYISNAHCKTKL